MNPLSGKGFKSFFNYISLTLVHKTGSSHILTIKKPTWKEIMKKEVDG